MIDIYENNRLNLVQFVNQVRDDLRARPVRLRDIRAKAAEIEAFGRGRYLERTVHGDVIRVMSKYCTLPERIALYRRQQAIYREHIRKGDFDDSKEKNVLISDLHGMCDWWLTFPSRFPYGDVRLLRPIIGEVLIVAAEWQRCPYPAELATLATWYEQLAPGGPLYPSDEHLDYVRRFEAFSENIIWERREYLTIVNFPAPKNALPPTDWWCTQHLIPPDDARAPNRP